MACAVIVAWFVYMAMVVYVCMGEDFMCCVIYGYTFDISCIMGRVVSEMGST